MQRALRRCGEERQAQFGLLGAGKLLFGLLGLFAQALHGHAVRGQVHAVAGLALFGHPVYDPLIKIIAAEVVVPAGGKHLHDTVPDADKRYIKGAAAQIVDHDGLGAAVVQPVGQRGGGRFVDDAAHIQPGDAPGVLGGLTLGIVEVGGHRNDRLGHSLAEVGLGVRLELLQDKGAQLLRRIAFAVHRHPRFTAHKPLYAGHGARGVGHSLPLGRLAHQPLPRLGERHNRGRCALALGIGDDDRLAALDHSHTAVCGPQINSDQFCHGGVCPFKKDNFDSCFYCSVYRAEKCCDFVNICRPIRAEPANFAQYRPAAARPPRPRRTKAANQAGIQKI